MLNGAELTNKRMYDIFSTSSTGTFTPGERRIKDMQNIYFTNRGGFKYLSLYVPFTNKDKGVLFAWGNGHPLVIETFSGFRFNRIIG